MYFRQGDLLSPYLFIIVADVLRAMVTHSFQQGFLAHPLIDDEPPAVLQYADDTLILLRASRDNLTHLKQLLDSFALATGLIINYNKSTFVPLHVDETEA